MAGKIFLVDDDPASRELLQEFLVADIAKLTKEIQQFLDSRLITDNPAIPRRNRGISAHLITTGFFPLDSVA